ncbi:hypothetical protein BofuT4_uP089040.1 [Botrytis cinerea T4]|uniref:Uncharacterized protein n=1 Tax=Botryotinia fuckeliana (strain T4) TaxID=999810 RepID=G2YFF7_BOTF4|nr:hypothetical protein BofuT4_uP089040.1 [Botrytis cinerea T4]
MYFAQSNQTNSSQQSEKKKNSLWILSFEVGLEIGILIYSIASLKKFVGGVAMR